MPFDKNRRDLGETEVTLRNDRKQDHSKVHTELSPKVVAFQSGASQGSIVG